MFKYYIELALLSFFKSKLLTTLIVAALSIGIGVSMTMISVLHVMSGDPIPQRSGELFYPHLNPARLGFGGGNLDPGSQFTWMDAHNLLRAHQASKQAIVVGGEVAITPPTAAGSFFAFGRYTSSEFFDMFGAPFSEGSSWRSIDDDNHSRVVVLNGELAQRLFGATSAIGRVVRLQGREFRVVGVLQNWHPVPLFYGGLSGDYAFRSEDMYFIPLETATEEQLPTIGSQICWGSGGKMGDQCTWLQFWVELRNPSEIASYQHFLEGYCQNQRQLGRFPSQIQPSLMTLRAHLAAMQLVPSEIGLQLWLSFGFLAVCLFNTVGLLLAKYLYRSQSISLRRALGARKLDVLMQMFTESLLLGTAAGSLGLIFACAGLYLIRLAPNFYAKLVHIDLATILMTLLLALASSLVAGIIPAWRVCQTPPALALKMS